jgi:hypothetical protein
MRPPCFALLHFDESEYDDWSADNVHARRHFRRVVSVASDRPCYREVEQRAEQSRADATETAMSVLHFSWETDSAPGIAAVSF